MSRVAVVGAGLAGLAATVDLAAAGAEVDLYERSRLLGGKATSFSVDGVEVDSGQHVHLACCTELIGLVDRVGLGDRLRLQDRFEAVVLRRGSAPARLRAARLPAPLHLVASFARYRHLGWAAKAQVGYALAAARRRSRPGETAAAWMRRHHQGGQAMSAFWEPFLVPALNASLDRVDAGIALFTIRTAFLGGAGAARIGDCTVPLARVAEAAAGHAAGVHRRTTVLGLTGTPRRVDGVVTDAGPAPYDGVVLAVPPSRLARILGRPEDFGVEGLDRFSVEPIVDVHLWYDGDVDAPGFFAVLDSPVQWGFRKGPDHLVCSMSAAGALVGRPEADLVALCHAELAAVLPSLAGRPPRRGAATRDPEATFVPTPGLRRPGNLTSAPNLVVAGAWTDTGWPATMESAVRSGRAAARLLAPARAARHGTTTLGDEPHPAAAVPHLTAAGVAATREDADD